MYSVEALRARPLRAPALLDEYEFALALARNSERDFSRLRFRHDVRGTQLHSVLCLIADASQASALSLARHIEFGAPEDLVAYQETRALAHHWLDFAPYPREVIEAVSYTQIREAQEILKLSSTRITSSRHWGEQPDDDDLGV